MNLTTRIREVKMQSRTLNIGFSGHPTHSRQKQVKPEVDGRGNHPRAAGFSLEAQTNLS